MATGELATPAETKHASEFRSGFLQLGGAKLADNAALPPSGWFTRLLLRNTPIPVLVHSLLDELGVYRPLQFVEDRYMPEPFLRYLSARGIDLGPPESFFLHDRRALRGGLVLAGRAPGESAADLREFSETLRQRLKHWLRLADRDATAAQLISVTDAEEFFSRRFVHYDPVGVLLWAAERSPIERWFGVRPTAADVLLLPARTIGAATPELPVGQLSAPEQPEEPPRLTAPALDESAVHESAVHERVVHKRTMGERPVAQETRDEPVAETSTATAESTAAGDPTETVHSSGCFQYRVVGRTRGPVSGGRKYHLRRDGRHLRIALLARENARLDPEQAVAFFDRLQSADDLIRAHRDLLRSLHATADSSESGAPVLQLGAGHGEGRNCSLSLELDCESGAFRCVAYGITPLFFRRKTGRLYELPQSNGPDQSLKTVEGAFFPGDALLLIPGTYTLVEQRDLAGRYRELLARTDANQVVPLSEDLAGSLGPWLDARLRGRGLFVSRDG